MTNHTPLRVLNLVSNRARFFRYQVESLAERNVRSESLFVPGTSTPDDSRSVVEYLRFLGPVLRESRGPYDLVHANFGLTAPHALAQLRHPVVVTLWGTDLHGPYGWVSELCGRYADAVIVMSERMAAALDYDCEVIPHGVDVETFYPEDHRTACLDVGWDPDEANVLFPYDPDRAVKNYPLAERVVAAARTHLDRPVRLRTVTGVSHDRVRTHMNAADALLLTSRWEGSPNTVKEALACNLPVVARPVGDVPERLDGVDPSAVGRTEAELVDGLVAVLRVGGRSNGRAAARELGHDRMADRIRAVYDRVT